MFERREHSARKINLQFSPVTCGLCWRVFEKGDPILGLRIL